MKPSLVAVGVAKAGVSADPVEAVPATVPLPDVYPDRDTPTVMVALCSGDKPVTVSNWVEPEAVPAETEPDETVGLQVKFES